MDEDLNAPATKADLADVKADLKADVAAVKADLAAVKAELKEDIAILRSEMHHMYDDLIERMENIETKLLQAFYAYAESNQKRIAEIETDQAALKSRLSTIEDRLTQVEKRLNMPPRA